MKKIFLIFAWLVVASLTIGGNAVAVAMLLDKSAHPITLSLQQNQVNVDTSADNSLPVNSQLSGIHSIVEGGDARVTIIANFLQRHDSPLKPYDQWGQKLVDIADKYGVDFRMLPAIAMQESNLCKAIPEGTHNCLGFGITSTQTLGFDSYEASFDRAARELKKNYIDEGRTTPEQIMQKYTPSSDGSWAFSVEQWISEMKYDDGVKGRELQGSGSNIMEFANPSPTATSSAAPLTTLSDTPLASPTATPTTTSTTPVGSLTNPNGQ